MNHSGYPYRCALAFFFWLFLLNRNTSHQRAHLLEVGREAKKGARDQSPSKLPTCGPVDIDAARESLVCLQKCKPPANRTIEGLGLDPDEKLNTTVRDPRNSWTAEYGKYRVHFPEENIYLNITKGHADDDGFDVIRPRSITERLFRRIIAKLFRAAVLDPAGNIVNTGSWVGDNAVPWALLLEQLRPETPGKVFAIDPSAKYVQLMADLANMNGVGNLCTQVAVFSSEEKTIFASTTEHMAVTSKNRGNIALQAITLDSVNLDNVSLLHIDVEGHESELLDGARSLLASSRPVVVTEGFAGWPPTDENNKKVLLILNSMGYHLSNEIPEICGWDQKCRNRIWWPDAKTEEAAMAVIGRDLSRPLVNWVATELPE